MAGNIQKRPNGKWRARYRDPTGKEHARHFDRKLDAQRWLAQVEVAKARGEWLDPALGKVTVGEWARTWLDGLSHLKPSTRARYAGILRTRLLPRWERVPLVSVSHGDVVAWVAELADEGLSSSSVRQTHRVLSLVLAMAVRDGRLSRNVAEGVRLPRTVSRDRRFLTHAQVAALAEAAGPDLGLIVKVLAYTGLRWGELAALQVQDVDLTRRRLAVSRSVTEVEGRAVFGTPKTHHRRSVPLPNFLVEELRIQVAGKPPGALVFTSPNGAVLRNNNFRRRGFDQAATRAGLDGLTPHELRHTAASLAVAAGANVKAVQRMLGHASAAMTLDVYAGLFGDDLDLVADRLDLAARAGTAGEDADQVRTRGGQGASTRR